jgi:hypothetical protein
MSEVICKTCGHTGDRKYESRGMLSIEVVLWLCLVIPGLIYSLWRHLSAVAICPSCGGKDFIPIDSPLGKKLAQEVAPATRDVARQAYIPKTGRKGGFAWWLGRLVGRIGKKRSD